MGKSTHVMQDGPEEQGSGLMGPACPQHLWLTNIVTGHGGPLKEEKHSAEKMPLLTT